MRNTIYLFFLFVLSSLLFQSCEDALEKENLKAINPDDVWNDPKLAEAYVNNLYARFMPGMAMNTGASSDEAAGKNGNTFNSWLKGTATIDSYNNWPYSNIRKINILLEEINSGSLKQVDIDLLSGQALFWRAWAYWGMVKGYGGVPLILRPQSPDEGEELFLPRNKTSECVAQIIKDLDDAINLLPESWSGSDYGRIDKGAVMAFKGRVLLHYASPQFNPSGNVDRWQDAYDANKAAVDFLVAQGKGLYQGDYANIWYEEGNKEVVMVNQYFDPGHTHNQNVLRPMWATKDNVGADRATLELVNAFPMKDGSAFDPDNHGYLNFQKNRDNRFYASIGYNGSPYYDIADLADTIYLWTYLNPEDISIESQIYNSQGGADWTGFYRLKALDKDVDGTHIDQCDVDWMEIRFTEVLMNLGEAANEVGQTTEALQVLYDVRARAGIEAGVDSKYGIKAAAKEQIREAYLNERFVEFCFEGKRWDDLRRHRRFDILNALGDRHGFKLRLKEGYTFDDGPKGKDNIDDFIQLFEPYIFPLETAVGEEFNLQDRYYFYAIPKQHLDRNSKLEQTQGWDNGTFDPLQ